MIMRASDSEGCGRLRPNPILYCLLPCPLLQCIERMKAAYQGAKSAKGQGGAAREEDEHEGEGGGAGASTSAGAAGEGAGPSGVRGQQRGKRPGGRAGAAAGATHSDATAEGIEPTGPKPRGKKQRTLFESGMAKVDKGK